MWESSSSIGDNCRCVNGRDLVPLYIYMYPMYSAPLLYLVYLNEMLSLLSQVSSRL